MRERPRRYLVEDGGAVRRKLEKATKGWVVDSSSVRAAFGGPDRPQSYRSGQTRQQASSDLRRSRYSDSLIFFEFLVSFQKAFGVQFKLRTTRKQRSRGFGTAKKKEEQVPG